MSGNASFPGGTGVLKRNRSLETLHPQRLACRAGSLSASSLPRRNVITGSIAAATSAALFGFALEPVGVHKLCHATRFRPFGAGSDKRTLRPRRLDDERLRNVVG